LAVKPSLTNWPTPGGKDPYELRRALLANQPRTRAVLDLVAQKQTGVSHYQREGAAVLRRILIRELCGTGGRSLGRQDGRCRVHRMVCAIDLRPGG